MTRLFRLLAVLVVTAPLCLAVAGCKQGVGERCQVASDCEDNLTCVIPGESKLGAGGICRAGSVTSDLAVTPTVVDMTTTTPQHD
jgi:hypothetical protein